MYIYIVYTPYLSLSLYIYMYMYIYIYIDIYTIYTTYSVFTIYTFYKYIYIYIYIYMGNRSGGHFRRLTLPHGGSGAILEPSGVYWSHMGKDGPI